MAIRGVHTADLHFGVTTYSRETPDGLGSRVHDFFKTFDRILEFIRENSIDLLLITGDIFKDREPNSTLRNMFYKRVVDISKEGVLVAIVPGNHDMHPFETKDHSVKVFEIFDQPNIVVMDRPFEVKEFEIRDEKLRIVAVPYLYLERFVDETFPQQTEELDMIAANFFEKKLSQALDSSENNIHTILAGHFTVVEAQIGSERSIMLGKDIKVPLSCLLNPKLKFVALGHIHKPQILHAANPTVLYCGSPDRIDFSEAIDSKGFVVFEIDKDSFRFEFQPVKVRPFCQLEIEVFEDEVENLNKELLDKIEEKIQMFEQNTSNSIQVSVVKLIIKTQSLIKEKIDVGLVERFLRDRCFVLAPIEIEVVDSQKDFRIAEVDEKSDPVDAFEKFLSASQKYRGIENKDKVVSEFKKLLYEVQEK